MTIHERFQRGAAVLTVSASVLSDADVDRLKSVIRSHLNSGVRRLILDFKHVQHLNSLGIGVLLHARRAMQTVRGELRVAGINENGLMILKRTSLQKYFPTFRDVDRALQVEQA
ncbi:MAG TPA: STAS domain-containing protein [Bacteroidota bacterium]|nr:STAS domain-containing protein [Bacteroidota bacterium]